MKRIAAGALALFAMLVATGTHGYSLPLWQPLLGGEEPEGVLLGELRPLRTDDWLVGIPIALAQAHHDPPFPRVNQDIGLGQDLILTDAPMRHWSTLFRPFVWGFFLGDDAGVAWMWWSQVVGMALAVFALLRSVAPARPALAGAVTLLLLASPFFQFWAFLPARFVAYAALACVAALGVLRAEHGGGRVGHALLLAWSLGCLGLALYPPYQLPLAQLAVLVFAAAAWQARGRLAERPGPVLTALGAAALGTVAIALGFVLDASDTLATMLSTAYPGERVSLGSDFPLWRIFAHTLVLGRAVDDWTPTLNIAEGASFWLLFPVTGAIAVWRASRGHADPLALALVAYLVLLVVFASAGLPAWLATATGLSWAQPSRTLVALGVADALLLARVLADRDAPPAPLPLLLGCVAAWCALLAGVGAEVVDRFASVGWAWIAAMIVLNAGVACALLRAAHPERWLLGLALVFLATTLHYNPLVRGGSAYLLENPLSQQIRALDAAAGGQSVWVSYGPPYPANLFRVLGVRAITGVHPVPQLALWQPLDPEGASERVYNRYAHVTARSSGAPGARFRLASPDSFELIVEPGAPELRRLGVTHALIVAPEAPTLPGVEHVGSHGRSHLYRLLPDDEAS